MKIKRIEHIAIAVNNMRENMDMLERVFDLKLDYVEEKPHIRLAMYPVADTYIELLEGKQPDSIPSKWIAERGEGYFHICFEVDDIVAALDELRGKGVALLDEKPRVGHGGYLIAFIDPESTGNLLVELAQAPEHPAH